ncbi:MAG: EamA family transporter [Anaerolineaceae bacterium]
MVGLTVVSLIWAFSFGLIKNTLAGVDSNFVAAARLLLAFLVFLPFLRVKKLPRAAMLRLMIVGAFQFGFMYIAYQFAFQFLKAYEVALFTIFTPLYVTLVNDLFKKRVNWVHLGTTLLAIIGTAIVKGAGIQSVLLTGFLLVQASNICFAFGQVYYKQVMKAYPEVKDASIMAMPYLGGVLVTGVTTLFLTNWDKVALSPIQGFTLLYLGIIASGFSFFLWNASARKVNTGTLAIFNDLKIPLAVTVSLVFFGEQTNMLNLLIGGAIILAALWLNEWAGRRKTLEPKPV